MILCVCVRTSSAFCSAHICSGTGERQQFCSETSPLTEADPPPSSAPQSAIKNTSLLLLHHHESHSNVADASSADHIVWLLRNTRRTDVHLPGRSTNQLSTWTSCYMLLSVAQHGAVGCAQFLLQSCGEVSGPVRGIREFACLYSAPLPPPARSLWA